MEISKVGVVGLGTMGAGIAQISVTAGHETTGREVTTELAERGRATIERYLGRAVEKERLSADERDAAVATAGYFGGVVNGPAIGFLARGIGLTGAISLIGVGAVLIALLGPRLER